MTQLTKELHTLEARIAVKQKELSRLEKQHKALLNKVTKKSLFRAMNLASEEELASMNKFMNRVEEL